MPVEIKVDKAKLSSKRLELVSLAASFDADHFIKELNSQSSHCSGQAKDQLQQTNAVLAQIYENLSAIFKHTIDFFSYTLDISESTDEAIANAIQINQQN